MSRDLTPDRCSTLTPGELRRLGDAAASECSTIRERSVAGITNDVPACPLHGAFVGDTCDDCGHHPDAHDRRGDTADQPSCEDCDAAAAVGQYAPCAYTAPNAPASGGAEGWTDDDTAELAEALSIAYARQAEAWSRLLAMARARREWLARDADHWTLARAASLAGIVSDHRLHGLRPADYRADEARGRAEAVGRVWHAMTRARFDGDLGWFGNARPYETSDGFEERHRADRLGLSTPILDAASAPR